MRECRSCAARESEAPFSKRNAGGLCLECRAESAGLKELARLREQRRIAILAYGKRRVANRMPKPVWSAPLFAGLRTDPRGR